MINTNEKNALYAGKDNVHHVKLSHCPIVDTSLRTAIKFMGTITG